MTAPVMTIEIPGLKRFTTGKVRDVYDLGDSLLLVATDRLSAFDVVARMAEKHREAYRRLTGHPLPFT